MLIFFIGIFYLWFWITLKADLKNTGMVRQLAFLKTLDIKYLDESASVL